MQVLASCKMRRSRANWLFETPFKETGYGTRTLAEIVSEVDGLGPGLDSRQVFGDGDRRCVFLGRVERPACVLGLSSSALAERSFAAKVVALAIDDESPTATTRCTNALDAN